MHWDLQEELIYLNEDDVDLPSEKISLRTVGIDIGSSTFHIMFADIILRRMGGDYYGGYVVTNRDIIYQSPVRLTPYADNNNVIDVEKIRDYIEQSYKAAQVTNEDVQSGAVITTGEAAKKKNAQKIIQLFSEQAGKFVTAAAGPKLESILAGHGSGAVKLSLSKQHAETVMNVDIGGGTTKVAIIKEGRILDTAAINMGARLIAWDNAGHICRIEETGYRMAEEIGVELQMDQKVSEHEKKKLGNAIAQKIIKFILQQDRHETDRYMVTENLKTEYGVGIFVFSGGVSEYIYGLIHEEYGDLGLYVGQAIKVWLDSENIHHHEPQQYIRATAIGASQYSVQISGNTIFLSDSEILPIWNIPVLHIHFHKGNLVDDLSTKILQKFKLLGIAGSDGTVAISTLWDTDPSYDQVEIFVQAVKKATQEKIASNQPIVLVFDKDIAGIVGNSLSQQIHVPIVAIDLVNLKELDYIDIGQEIPESKAVPVNVKSLVFT